MVRSSRAVARVTVTTCEEGSSYSKSTLKKPWSERLRVRGRDIISLLPVQKRAKRRAAAAFSSTAKHISRTAKRAAGKRKIQKDDEVNTYPFQQYPVSGNLSPGYQDSGYISPEYHSDTDVEDIQSRPMSPSTKQKHIDETRRKYMTKAKQALEYYHEKHPGDHYAPVNVDLKLFMHIIDKAGYYIHMNFTAENQKTKAEEVFFAELLLPHELRIYDYTVTACDIVGPESPGGLRNVFVPNGILFVGDTMDVKNCYACYDDMKHPEGDSMYQAGHSGHSDYHI